MFPERQKPRLIPVLDVMNGVVVRAVGGQRGEYRPIVSPLTDVCDPETVLHVLRERADAFEVYIADLDAIRGSGEISPALDKLIKLNRFFSWIDAGLRS